MDETIKTEASMNKAEVIRKIMKDGITLTVVSDSMLPKLKIGQEVRINAKCKPKFGDIIVFFSCNNLIIHRFYFRINSKCFTRGDNQRYFDRPWEFNNYIGKADVSVAFLEKIWMAFIIAKSAPRFLLRAIGFQKKE